ncbi:MAG: hypothetical protein ABDH63_04740 [Candidatus Caldarchaeales archaeon]
MDRAGFEPRFTHRLSLLLRKKVGKFTEKVINFYVQGFIIMSRVFHNTIALIMDCDDTLCEDTTDACLKQIGIEDPLEDFWKKRVKPKVKDGWDPPLAYMTEFINVAKEKGTKLTKDFLRK